MQLQQYVNRFSHERSLEKKLTTSLLKLTSFVLYHKSLLGDTLGLPKRDGCHNFFFETNQYFCTNKQWLVFNRRR